MPACHSASLRGGKSEKTLKQISTSNPNQNIFDRDSRSKNLKNFRFFLCSKTFTTDSHSNISIGILNKNILTEIPTAHATAVSKISDRKSWRILRVGGAVRYEVKK